jgi:hypothetical protein
MYRNGSFFDSQVMTPCLVFGLAVQVFKSLMRLWIASPAQKVSLKLYRLQPGNRGLMDAGSIIQPLLDDNL